MSKGVCCVPGCLVTSKDVGNTLHRFPCPDNDAKRFEAWISNIGGDLATLDVKFVHKNRRVCRRHFEEVYLYPGKKLCKVAVPQLHLSEPETPGFRNHATDLMLTEGPFPENMQPTTSGLNTQVADLMSGLQVEKPQSYGQKLNKQQHNKKGIFGSLAQQHKKFKIVQNKLNQCQKKILLKKKYIMAKKMTRTHAFNIVSKHMKSTAALFCKMQVTQAKKKNRGRRFTLEEKILALSLYKPSPKAYRILSNICILPSRRTLQDLLFKINLKPGINHRIFENLKKRVEKLPEKYRYCTILFDEMAIAPGVSYNKRNDKIIGFVDNGESVENNYCDHVLVFMVRGVVMKYKQPIAFYYCGGSTKAIELKKQITDVIRKVQETGLKVIATICDQGTSNMAAINLLLKDTLENIIKSGAEYKERFITIEDQKIFPIFDPPHLIKGVRNNLLTKNLKYKMNGKLCTAKWEHIVALYNRSPGYRGVKLVPKLTAQHALPTLIPKMRVKHCTQVFSKSVGVAIGYMAECGQMELASMETADLLMFFDDLFDSVNGSFSQVKNGKIYRSAVTPKSPHHKLWNEALPILKSMYFEAGNNKGVVPSLSSWVKTIESFKSIVRYLNSKGVNSLLLRNINQDALENFFGAIRAHGYSNIMPTAIAFEGAFKTLLINNISSSHSVGANCEKDDSFCLQSLKYFLMDPAASTPIECEEEIDQAHLFIEPVSTDEFIKSENSVHAERSAAISYCSGWVAQLAKKNIYKKCSTCKVNMEAVELENFHQYIKKKEYGGKKWLCYPTRALFDFFAQIENICLNVIKDKCNANNIKNYIKLIINVNLDTLFLTCSEHKNELAEFLINKSTIFFVNNWCKDVNNVLIGKTTFWDLEDPMKIKANAHYHKNKGRRQRKTM